MRGVVVRKAKVIAEDERRKIISVLNGEIGVRDIHILEMKKGQTKSVLGQHFHTYKEVCFIFKGKVHYWLKNNITGEEEELDLESGDLMFRDGHVVHTCTASEDCIMIDGAECTWIDDEWNHYPEKLI